MKAIILVLLAMFSVSAFAKDRHYDRHHRSDCRRCENHSRDRNNYDRYDRHHDRKDTRDYHRDHNRHR